MIKKSINILDDTVNYLKFFRENSNYQIYKSEMNYPEKSTDLSDMDSNNYYTEKEEAISKIETLKEETILVRESATNSTIPLISESWMEAATFGSFAAEISNCRKCKILSGRRKHVVFGTGNPEADLVVVGEAPGADEDEQGKPFVGRAGKLLTEILQAINFTREEVFICNILKCRPPDNRNPLPDEIANCEPYLFKQLEMIKPKLILAVGTFASQTLLRSKEPLGKLRGRFHMYKGIKMMVTYHPAALLRNPNWKRPTWEDVQLLRKEYDKIVNSL